MQGEEKEIVVNPPGREALRLAYDLIVAHILPRMLGEKEGDQE
ncbi:hypothetical protein [Brevibacillus sp. SYP-B805]|nr:hypothetical protein [Brevibacillus sp. SYP-B805]